MKSSISIVCAVCGSEVNVFIRDNHINVEHCNECKKNKESKIRIQELDHENKEIMGLLEILEKQLEQLRKL